MKRYPLVYVMTLNWNGKRFVCDCVSSVLKSDYPNFKIVVIDNGSTDDSIYLVRERFGKQVEIIENAANLGYARGFNVGLKYCFNLKGAAFCLVMNNDTILDHRAISALIRVAKSDIKVGFVTGKVYFYDKPNVLQTVGKKADPIRWNGEHIGFGEDDFGQYDEVRELHFADDIFTLVTRKVYEETGGYNPMFFLQGEEYDWQARAKKLGYKIMYTPFARLWHRVSMTIGRDSALKAYYDARNPMLVILLHKSPDFFKKYVRYHFFGRVLRSSFVYLKQGRLSPALAKWQGFLSAIKWGLKNKKLTLRHFV